MHFTVLWLGENQLSFSFFFWQRSVHEHLLSNADLFLLKRICSLILRLHNPAANVSVQRLRKNIIGPTVLCGCHPFVFELSISPLPSIISTALKSQSLPHSLAPENVALVSCVGYGCRERLLGFFYTGWGWESTSSTFRLSARSLLICPKHGLCHLSYLGPAKL